MATEINKDRLLEQLRTAGYREPAISRVERWIEEGYPDVGEVMSAGMSLLYNERQLSIMERGFQTGVDVMLYADPSIPPAEMLNRLTQLTREKDAGVTRPDMEAFVLSISTMDGAEKALGNALRTIDLFREKRNLENEGHDIEFVLNDRSFGVHFYPYEDPETGEETSVQFQSSGERLSRNPDPEMDMEYGTPSSFKKRVGMNERVGLIFFMENLRDYLSKEHRAMEQSAGNTQEDIVMVRNVRDAVESLNSMIDTEIRKETTILTRERGYDRSMQDYFRTALENGFDFASIIAPDTDRNLIDGLFTSMMDWINREMTQEQEEAFLESYYQDFAELTEEQLEQLGSASASREEMDTESAELANEIEQITEAQEQAERNAIPAEQEDIGPEDETGEQTHMDAGDGMEAMYDAMAHSEIQTVQEAYEQTNDTELNMDTEIETDTEQDTSTEEVPMPQNLEELVSAGYDRKKIEDKGYSEEQMNALLEIHRAGHHIDRLLDSPRNLTGEEIRDYGRLYDSVKSSPSRFPRPGEYLMLPEELQTEITLRAVMRDRSLNRSFKKECFDHSNAEVRSKTAAGSVLCYSWLSPDERTAEVTISLLRSRTVQYQRSNARENGTGNAATVYKNAMDEIKRSIPEHVIGSDYFRYNVRRLEKSLEDDFKKNNPDGPVVTLNLYENLGMEEDILSSEDKEIMEWSQAEYPTERIPDSIAQLRTDGMTQEQKGILEVAIGEGLNASALVLPDIEPERLKVLSEELKKGTDPAIVMHIMGAGEEKFRNLGLEGDIEEIRNRLIEGLSGKSVDEIRDISAYLMLPDRYQTEKMFTDVLEEARRIRPAWIHVRVNGKDELSPEIKTDNFGYSVSADNYSDKILHPLYEHTKTEFLNMIPEEDRIEDIKEDYSLYSLLPEEARTDEITNAVFEDFEVNIQRQEELTKTKEEIESFMDAIPETYYTGDGFVPEAARERIELICNDPRLGITPPWEKKEKEAEVEQGTGKVIPEEEKKDPVPDEPNPLFLKAVREQKERQSEVDFEKYKSSRSGLEKLAAFVSRVVYSVVATIHNLLDKDNRMPSAEVREAVDFKEELNRRESQLKKTENDKNVILHNEKGLEDKLAELSELAVKNQTDLVCETEKGYIHVMANGNRANIYISEMAVGENGLEEQSNFIGMYKPKIYGKERNEGREKKAREKIHEYIEKNEVKLKGVKDNSQKDLPEAAENNIAENKDGEIRGNNDNSKTKEKEITRGSDRRDMSPDAMIEHLRQNENQVTFLICPENGNLDNAEIMRMSESKKEGFVRVFSSEYKADVPVEKLKEELSKIKKKGYRFDELTMNRLSDLDMGTRNSSNLIKALYQKEQEPVVIMYDQIGYGFVIDKSVNEEGKESVKAHLFVEKEGGYEFESVCPVEHMYSALNDIKNKFDNQDIGAFRFVSDFENEQSKELYEDIVSAKNEIFEQNPEQEAPEFAEEAERAATEELNRGGSGDTGLDKDNEDAIRMANFDSVEL